MSIVDPPRSWDTPGDLRRALAALDEGNGDVRAVLGDSP
jgi:hypothetical protein